MTFRFRIYGEDYATGDYGISFIWKVMTSSYVAKFIIEEDKMYTENANRATKYGMITPETLEPNPQNPVIASFFNQIGYADELGSGTRNLFKYASRYSGKEPRIMEDAAQKDISRETNLAVGTVKRLMGESSGERNFGEKRFKTNGNAAH